MSNIGKQKINLSEGVSAKIEDGEVFIEGPKGGLNIKIPSGINVDVGKDAILVSKNKDIKELKKFHGLIRALIANMVLGVSKGFEKKLKLSGVGYRAKMEGQDLVLNVGYANPIKVKALEGVNISVSENTIIVSGIDKRLVGDVADNIRKVRPPDPYKAKGIKYEDEKIRRKVGKAAAKATQS